MYDEGAFEGFVDFFAKVDTCSFFWKTTRNYRTFRKMQTTRKRSPSRPTRSAIAQLQMWVVLFRVLQKKNFDEDSLIIWFLFDLRSSKLSLFQVVVEMRGFPKGLFLAEIGQPIACLHMQELQLNTENKEPHMTTVRFFLIFLQNLIPCVPLPGLLMKVASWLISDSFHATIFLVIHNESIRFFIMSGSEMSVVFLPIFV